jgi:hypothetical protein
MWRTLMASNAIVDSVVARGCITDDDVTRMQRAYYSDASITEGEATELFNLNAKCHSQTGSWTRFFAETISNFVLQQKTPDGRISETNAKWLASRITCGDKISDAERAVLMTIKRQSKKIVPVLKPLFERVA